MTDGAHPACAGEILDAIRSAVAQLPALEPVGLYSHRMFPNDRAWQFRSPDGELMTCGGPGFWNRIPIAPSADDAAVAIKRSGALSLAGFPIVDLDNEKRRADLQRVFRAFALALGLPTDASPF